MILSECVHVNVMVFLRYQTFDGSATAATAARNGLDNENSGWHAPDFGCKPAGQEFLQESNVRLKC
jgi:hypothetical protein